MSYETVFVYLLLGHLIGDMVLQSNYMIRSSGQSFKGTLLHSIVVTLVTAAVYFCSKSEFIMVYVIIFIGHTMIDEVKRKLDPRNNSLKLMIVDQVVHVLFLWVLVLTLKYSIKASSDPTALWPHFYNLMSPVWSHKAVTLCGLILSVQFGHNLVQKTVRKYVDKSECKDYKGEIAIIGHMIRLMVFIFAVNGEMAAIAILLAGKGIYDYIRYSELKDKQVKLDYIMIGTFLNFGWATAVGGLVDWLI